MGVPAIFNGSYVKFLKNALRLGALTADPSGDAAGDLYFNSSSNALKFRNNSGWQSITAGTTSTAAVLLHWSGGSLTATHDADVKYTWASASFTKLSQFTHSSGTFTATVPGYYQVTFSPFLEAAVDAAIGRQFIAKVYKNGSFYSRSGSVQGTTNNLNSGGTGPSGSNNITPNPQVTTVVYLNGTTDYIECYSYQANGSGTNRTYTAGTLYINYLDTPAGTTGATPTIQRLTSGSGTYTTPAGVRYLRVRMVGGGGGGSGSGTGTPGAGGAGGDTTFGALTAGGGGGGPSGLSSQSAGGANSGSLGTIVVNIDGQASGVGDLENGFPRGSSGSPSPFGGAGTGGVGGMSGGSSAKANSGSGGGGAGSGGGGSNYAGAGGAAGGYLETIITSPSGTYSYSVGAGGTAGAVGGGTAATGGAGGSGVIIVEEYY